MYRWNLKHDNWKSIESLRFSVTFVFNNTLGLLKNGRSLTAHPKILIKNKNTGLHFQYVQLDRKEI